MVTFGEVSWLFQFNIIILWQKKSLCGYFKANTYNYMEKKDT